MTSKKKIKQLLLTITTILFLSAFAQGETVVPDCGDGRNDSGASLSGDRIQDEANMLSWADGSPPSVSANSSGTATVVGGHPPYIWNIGGSDYSFSASSQDNSETTQEASIIIYGNNFNNCNPPSAIITVTASIDGGQDLIEGTISPPTVAFDYDNAPPSVDGDAQITPGSSSATVYVTGGVPPYTWSVSPNTGTDYFTLAYAGPASSNSNTVYLHGNPCLAEITITDDCGNVATGHVRGPGQWGDPIDGSVVCGSEGSVTVGKTRTKIEGRYKQTHTYEKAGSTGYSRPCESSPQYWIDMGILEEGETVCSGLCVPWAAETDIGMTTCLWEEDIIPCRTGGFQDSRCYCRRTTQLYYQEWECVP